MPQKHNDGLSCTEKTIGDYNVMSTIGHGSTGKVKLGIHQITGKKAAIKIVPRSQLYSSLKIKQAVERELAILQLLHHPNLIELYQVMQDSENVYFVTEYVPGGELYHLLRENDGYALSEPDARHIFSQIASALSWCHARHICHRDLKPENILFDKSNKKIKIADFGMAIMQSPTKLLKTSCGSPHYASPEVIRGIPYYGPAADIWSAGIILYILLAGRLPFDDPHVGQLLAKIKRGRFTPLPDWVSSSAKDLVYRMLVVNPNKRINSNGVLSHPWLLSFSKSTEDSLPIPPTLSIHSFSFHCNPWYDEQLKSPSIYHSNDLDGPTRETLKILWRGLSHEEIITALREKEPNVQKLTFQLLRQRQKRASVGSECHTTPRQTCDTDKWMHSIPLPSPPLDTKHKLCAPLNSHLYTKRSLVAQTFYHATALFQYSKTSSLEKRFRKNNVQQIITANIASLKHYLINKYSRLLITLFGSNKKGKLKIFSIDCLARSEYVAAGKLHYILFKHFGGTLNGCMYPDGKILWSGRTDDASIYLKDNHCRTSFACRIKRMADSKASYTMTLSTYHDDPDFAERLQALFYQYEQDSTHMIKLIDQKASFKQASYFVRA